MKHFIQFMPKIKLPFDLKVNSIDIFLVISSSTIDQNINLLLPFNFQRIRANYVFFKHISHEFSILNTFFNPFSNLIQLNNHLTNFFFNLTAQRFSQGLVFLHNFRCSILHLIYHRRNCIHLLFKTAFFIHFIPVSVARIRFHALHGAFKGSNDFLILRFNHFKM